MVYPDIPSIGLDSNVTPTNIFESLIESPTNCKLILLSLSYYK
jgi:hypothetical protein